MMKQFTQLRLFPKNIDNDSYVVDSDEESLLFITFWNGVFNTEFLMELD